ncbi:MAG TPA: alpha/beta fold hydrolase [Thermoanaerobaculia bacterium]|nr:alpha/beta fold hydrolase [Thermoanaerobaculia bacterium]
MPHSPRVALRTLRSSLLTAALLVALVAGAQAPDDGLTLERIMAHPDWLGNAPESPYWTDDGRSIYYLQKRPGEEQRDLVEIGVEGELRRVVGLGETGSADAPGGSFSPDRTRKVYERAGDLFVKELAAGTVRQLTRTAAAERAPSFLADGRRVSFHRGNDLFVRDLESGLEEQLAELRLEKDPMEKKPPEGYLAEQQLRLFDFLSSGKERKEAAEARELAERRADPTRLAPPFYLGEGVEIRQVSLAPNARFLLVVLGKKDESPGRKDMMPAWVTESGYVEPKEVRAKVGTGEEASERLVLIDLASREQKELDLAALPGIEVDPLAELKRRAEERKKRKTEVPATGGVEQEDLPVATPDGATPSPQQAAEPPPVEPEVVPVEVPAEPAPVPPAEPAKPRPVTFGPILWSPAGDRVAVTAFSRDNKDRWISLVDLETRALVTLHRLHDEAWVGWDFHDVGWLPDGSALYYLSEETGFSQLYLLPMAEGAAGRRLTEGQFVVSNVVASRDGAWLYFLANAEHPGIYEVHRVSVATGAGEALTRLGGLNQFWLSPDESRLLVLHSKALEPPELYLQDLRPDSEPRRLTHTVSDEFRAIAWTPPSYVAIPSNHAAWPIHARVYAPVGIESASPEARFPAVFFIHGAGYLQNAHQGWSTYFREMMFHTLLTRRGYFVVDLDYRASAGYGRDWRTAIYRRMGTPELEDLEDAIAWLTARHPLDRERLGIYGGSYGGFLALMALFKRPDLFAAGAALRPVTDWAHYNHSYTASILNTPSVDPEAYEASSPIEFADGLEKPLLICAPMQDDNVFFQDTVRLAQRLIELGKEDWEVAIYPVEPHSFRQPSSWLDEYRRILKLFERYLKR